MTVEKKYVEDGLILEEKPNNTPMLKCKRLLKFGSLLRTAICLLDILICPKSPKEYKMMCDNDDEYSGYINLGKMTNSLLVKVCRIMIMLNRSQNVCKMLNYVGILFKDGIKDGWINAVDEVLEVLITGDGLMYKIFYYSLLVDKSSSILDENMLSEYIVLVGDLILLLDNGEVIPVEMLEEIHNKVLMLLPDNIGIPEYVIEGCDECVSLELLRCALQVVLTKITVVDEVPTVCVDINDNYGILCQNVIDGVEGGSLSCNVLKCYVDVGLELLGCVSDNIV